MLILGGGTFRYQIWDSEAPASQLVLKYQVVLFICKMVRTAPVYVSVRPPTADTCSDVQSPGNAGVSGSILVQVNFHCTLFSTFAPEFPQHFQ